MAPRCIEHDKHSSRDCNKMFLNYKPQPVGVLIESCAPSAPGAKSAIYDCLVDVCNAVTNKLQLHCH